MGLGKAPAWLTCVGQWGAPNPLLQELCSLCRQHLPTPRVALIVLLLLPLGVPWPPPGGWWPLLGGSDPFLCPKGETWPESPRSLAASLPYPDSKFCPSLLEGALGELPRGAATPLVWHPGGGGRVLDPWVLSGLQGSSIWPSLCFSFPLRLMEARFRAGEGLVLAGAGGTLGSRLVFLSRSIHLSDPSLLMGDAPADPPPAEAPRSEPPSPTEEERDLPEPAAAPRSPRASPLLPEAAGGSWPDTESEEAPSDHPDGKRPPSWEEKRLFLGTPQPEGPVDHAGEEFTFLEVSGGRGAGASFQPPRTALGAPGCHRDACLGALLLSPSGDGGFSFWPWPPLRGRLCIQGPPVLLWGPWACWVGGVGVSGLPGAGH